MGCMRPCLKNHSNPSPLPEKVDVNGESDVQTAVYSTYHRENTLSHTECKIKQILMKYNLEILFCF